MVPKTGFAYFNSKAELAAFLCKETRKQKRINSLWTSVYYIKGCVYVCVHTSDNICSLEYFGEKEMHTNITQHNTI